MQIAEPTPFAHSAHHPTPPWPGEMKRPDRQGLPSTRAALAPKVDNSASIPRPPANFRRRAARHDETDTTHNENTLYTMRTLQRILALALIALCVLALVQPSDARISVRSYVFSRL